MSCCEVAVKPCREELGATASRSAQLADLQSAQGKAGIASPNNSPLHRVGKEYTADAT